MTDNKRALLWTCNGADSTEVDLNCNPVFGESCKTIIS